MTDTGTTTTNVAMFKILPDTWGFCYTDVFKLNLVEEINAWMADNYGPKGFLWDTKPMAFQAAAEHYKAMGLDRRMYMFDKKEDFVAFKLAWL